MMKNVTFNVDEKLIRSARMKAMENHQTLNEVFRQWLKSYVNSNATEDYAALMKKLAYVEPGQHFSRDEMNER